MPRQLLFLCLTVFTTVAAQVSAISTCHAQGPTSLRDALGITAANPDVSVDFDFGDATYFIDDGNWSLIANEFSNGTFDIRSGATLTTAGSEFNNLSVLGDLTLADRFTGWSVVNGGFSLDGTWENRGGTINFSGSQLVDGDAIFQHTNQTNRLTSSFRADGTTFGSGVVFRSTNADGNAGGMRLEGGSFDLGGRVEADGGLVTINATDFTNRGTISATNGGFLDFFGETINNEGHIEVIGAGLSLDGGLPFTGPGTFEIRDSVLSFQNMDIDELQAISGTNLTYAPRNLTQFDLGDTTLNIDDEDGKRWVLGGGFSNGTIESENGFELEAWTPAGMEQPGLLSNVILNADLRIGQGAGVRISDDIEGSGRIILDGGSITLDSANNAPMSSEVLDLIEQNSGVVTFGNSVDNTGRTTVFRDGVDYLLNPFTSAFPRFFGGRIEAETELRVKSFPEGPFSFDSVTTGSDIRLTNSSDGRLTLINSLTLDNASLILGEKSEEHDQSGSLTNFYSFTDNGQIDGSLNIDGTGELRFEGNQTGIENTGVNQFITFRSGGVLSIGSGVDVVATEGNGEILMGSGELINDGDFKVGNGHALKIDSADVTANGLLEVGNASRFVVTDGDLTFGENSSTQLTISTTDIGFVGVEGEMNLDGSLSIDTSGVPQGAPEGFEFTMMQSDLRSGIFNSVSIDSFSDDLTFAVTYTGTSVLATTARIGDIDLSQSVTQADDVAPAISNLGVFETQTWVDGDIDGDGRVTAAGDVIDIIARVDTDLTSENQSALGQFSQVNTSYDIASGDLSIFAENVDAIVLSSASGGLSIDPNVLGSSASFSNEFELAWLLDDADTAGGIDSLFASGNFFTDSLPSDLIISYTLLGSGQVFHANISAVPEPAAAVLGLGLLVGLLSRRRRTA